MDGHGDLRDAPVPRRLRRDACPPRTSPAPGGCAARPPSAPSRCSARCAATRWWSRPRGTSWSRGDQVTIVGVTGNLAANVAGTIDPGPGREQLRAGRRGRRRQPRRDASGLRPIDRSRPARPGPELRALQPGRGSARWCDPRHDHRVLLPGPHPLPERQRRDHLRPDGGLQRPHHRVARAGGQPGVGGHELDPCPRSFPGAPVHRRRR